MKQVVLIRSDVAAAWRRGAARQTFVDPAWFGMDYVAQHGRDLQPRPFTKLMVVGRGHGTCEAQGVEFGLVPGDVLVVPPDVDHRINARQSSLLEVFWVGLDDEGGVG